MEERAGREIRSPGFQTNVLYTIQIQYNSPYPLWNRSHIPVPRDATVYNTIKYTLTFIEKWHWINQTTREYWVLPSAGHLRWCLWAVEAESSYAEQETGGNKVRLTGERNLSAWGTAISKNWEAKTPRAFKSCRVHGKYPELKPWKLRTGGKIELCKKANWGIAGLTRGWRLWPPNFSKRNEHTWTWNYWDLVNPSRHCYHLYLPDSKAHGLNLCYTTSQGWASTEKDFPFGATASLFFCMTRSLPWDLQVLFG